MLTEQQITKIIEAKRILGVFTAKGVIEAVREVLKIECKNFLKFFFESEFQTIDGAWEAYSKSSEYSSIVVHK